MPAEALRFSIVTACFNAEAHLEDTLASIEAQSWPHVEHIVIDGGSTDQTLAILARHRPDRLVSERDDGISDAMNKGIALATGDYVAFIHGDDMLAAPAVLAEAAAVIEAAGRPGIIGLPIAFSGAAGRRIQFQGRPPLRPWLKGYAHQGTLVRRDLFERFGRFDTAHRICMDYDFFLRCHRGSERLVAAPAPVLAVMRDTGISSRLDWPSLSRRFAEERAVHFRHAPHGAAALLYRLWWALYLPFRRLRLALLGR